MALPCQRPPPATRRSCAPLLPRRGGTVVMARGTALQFSFPTVVGRRRGCRGCPARPTERSLARRGPAGAAAGAHGASCRDGVPGSARTYAPLPGPDAIWIASSPAGHPGQVLVSAVVASMLQDLLAAAGGGSGCRGDAAAGGHGSARPGHRTATPITAMHTSSSCWPPACRMSFPPLGLSIVTPRPAAGSRLTSWWVARRSSTRSAISCCARTCVC